MLSRSEFMVNRDETGKLIVDMYDGTNQSYLVEFIGNGYSDWGDIDPATKKVTGSYGAKYTGSVKPNESVLVPENGYNDSPEIKGGSYMHSVMIKHEAWKKENGYG